MPEIVTAVRDAFPLKTIVIVGDVVADQFLHGTISRVSREAPVFILRHDDTLTLPGGAANAAANVASLGANPILIGCTGRDESGEMLISALSAAGVEADGLYRGTDMRTTTKQRVLASQHYAARQQMIRIDYENPTALSDEARGFLRAQLASAIERADAVIISDYGYGAVFPGIFDDALKLAAGPGIPVVVDSRYDLEKMANATSATPNRDEVEQMLGTSFTNDDCARLCERLGLTALLVTNGNKGMSLYEKGHSPQHIDAVGPTEPVDVTGAGDTVIAAYALGLAAGLDFVQAARTANHAGGIVVMKKRTATVTAAELIDSLTADEAARSSHAQG